MDGADQGLMPNERVLSTGRIHWIVYLPGAAALLAGLCLVAVSAGSIGWIGSMIGWIGVLAGAASVVRAWMTTYSTELALTNKRIIAKSGYVHPADVVDLTLSKVESFQVKQCLIGRLLGFGTVVIQGRGGARTPIRPISSPLAFRSEALKVIEVSRRRPVRPAATPSPT